MSIKYQNLLSFKEGLILLCQSILETRRITHLHGPAHFTIPLDILYLKSKFRQISAKIKTSSDLLENLYTSQFEGAEYESDIGILQFFYSKPKFWQMSPKSACEQI